MCLQLAQNLPKYPLRKIKILDVIESKQITVVVRAFLQVENSFPGKCCRYADVLFHTENNRIKILVSFHLLVKLHPLPGSKGSVRFVKVDRASSRTVSIVSSSPCSPPPLLLVRRFQILDCVDKVLSG